MPIKQNQYDKQQISRIKKVCITISNNSLKYYNAFKQYLATPMFTNQITIRLNNIIQKKVPKPLKTCCYPVPFVPAGCLQNFN